MISLEQLAALHREHGAALAHEVSPVVIDDVTVGGDQPVLMGVVNLSRDSTYRESVAVSTESAVRLGRLQAAAGAAIIDVGAEASVTGAERVGVARQIDLLTPVVATLAKEAVVSVETYEPEVVRACLESGARVLNMTGREHEPEMLDLAAAYDAAVVLCFGEVANVRTTAEAPTDDPIPALLEHFAARLEEARRRGVSKLVVDPGIGFSYDNLHDWRVRGRYQARMLAQSFRLWGLGVPVCNALPHTHDLFEDQYRQGEALYGVIAALGGTHLMRVHEVAHLRVVLRAMRELAVR